MIKRLLKAALFILFLPLIAISAVATIFSAPLAIIVYIFNGGREDEIMDLALIPFTFTLNLKIKTEDYLTN
jgi:hypothetical protein